MNRRASFFSFMFCVAGVCIARADGEDSAIKGFATPSTSMLNGQGNGGLIDVPAAYTANPNNLDPFGLLWKQKLVDLLKEAREGGVWLKTAPDPGTVEFAAPEKAFAKVWVKNAAGVVLAKKHGFWPVLWGRKDSFVWDGRRLGRLEERAYFDWFGRRFAGWGDFEGYGRYPKGSPEAFANQLERAGVVAEEPIRLPRRLGGAPQHMPRPYGGLGARVLNAGGGWGKAAGVGAGLVAGSAGSIADDVVMSYLPDNDLAGLSANFGAQAGVLGLFGGIKLAATSFSPVGFAVTVGTHVIKQQARADKLYYETKIRGARIPLPAGHGYIGASTADKRTDYENTGWWLSSFWRLPGE
jgi:hypothetical protein